MPTGRVGRYSEILSACDWLRTLGMGTSGGKAATLTPTHADGSPVLRLRDTIVRGGRAAAPRGGSRAARASNGLSEVARASSDPGYQNRILTHDPPVRWRCAERVGSYGGHFRAMVRALTRDFDVGRKIRTPPRRPWALPGERRAPGALIRRPNGRGIRTGGAASRIVVVASCPGISSLLDGAALCTAPRFVAHTRRPHASFSRRPASRTARQRQRPSGPYPRQCPSHWRYD